jgi:hypothetical protein
MTDYGNIMCRINNETILRANQKTMNRKELKVPTYPNGEIVASVRYNGINYEQYIKIRDVNAKFKRSIELIRNYGKKI